MFFSLNCIKNVLRFLNVYWDIFLWILLYTRAFHTGEWLGLCNLWGHARVDMNIHLISDNQVGNTSLCPSYVTFFHISDCHECCELFHLRKWILYSDIYAIRIDLLNNFLAILYSFVVYYGMLLWYYIWYIWHILQIYDTSNILFLNNSK